MSAAKAKRAVSTEKPQKKKRKKPPVVGFDGLTTKQRLYRLMEERGVGQTQLARLCSEFYAGFVGGSDDRFKQQHVGNFIQNDQDSAEWLVIAAKVFDVNPIWLQFGIGNKEAS
jgi:hypothetical protein